MKRKLLTVLMLVSGVVISYGYADNTLRVVTNEAELRNITDTYRSNPHRPKDFIPQNDGTVIDKRTGLMWLQCTVGLKWNGKNCEGEETKLHWQEAKQQKVTFAGYSDWRLPTRFELETLVFCDGGKDNGRDGGDTDYPYWLNACVGDRYIKQAFPFNNDSYAYYWSASAVPGDEESGCGVDFYDGQSTYDYGATYYLSSILVRTPQ